MLSVLLGWFMFFAYQPFQSSAFSFFRGKLGRYPPWPGKVSSENMPLLLQGNRMLYAKNRRVLFIIVLDSKPSQGPEKAPGQKMPFCKILWNGRPVSHQ